MNRPVRCFLVCSLTASVLVAGVAAILAGLAENIALAAELIILAAILDGFDGTLARTLKAESRFGERMDTYVDTIAFGVAPAIVAYQALWADYGLWGGVAAFLIILSAVLRFSRGCSYPSLPGRRVFQGLPIPVSATWIAVWLLIMDKDLLDIAPVHLERGALLVAAWTVAFSLLVLQVSNVRYLKPSRRHLRNGMLATAALAAVTGHPLTIFCLATAAALLVYVTSGLIRHRERAAAAVAAEEAEDEIPFAR